MYVFIGSAFVESAIYWSTPNVPVIPDVGIVIVVVVLELAAAIVALYVV